MKAIHSISKVYGFAKLQGSMRGTLDGILAPVSKWIYLQDAAKFSFSQSEEEDVTF